MPGSERQLGPLRPISSTASELVARQIVTRLCQQPPRGMTWKEFAVWEIARNLNAFARSRTNSSPTNTEPSPHVQSQ
jgi:hypothetical protein